MSLKRNKERIPWLWVPSLYFAEGIPYVIVMMLAGSMYKTMGISNARITLYTAWLYLPWVIKPLWSPLVDIFKTKRLWIVVMQLIVGAGLGAVALTIPLPNFFKVTLGFFWLLAFTSATHDIAADGFYMLGLSEHQQAWFVGIRSTFYRLAMITGQGLLLFLAYTIESHTGLPTVDVNAYAIPGAPIEQIINVDFLDTSPREGDLRIICEPRDLTISTKPRSRSEVDSTVALARDWNAARVPTSEEQSLISPVARKKEDGWWGRAVVTKLESFLREHFGEKQEPVSTDFAGNVAIIHFRLSRQPKPETSIIVNFGLTSGDKSISLIEGNRMVFTKDNWNKPALAVIQVDPKLTQTSEAHFQARAGNIPLGWIVSFSAICALFLVFFIYHGLILPYPDQDIPADATKGFGFMREFFQTFATFLTKDRIGVIIAFLLLYRFGEAQLVKLAPLFMLDFQEVGGLALTMGQVGIYYGTLGIIMLVLGGILGGFLAARNGLKYWIWWMALAMNLPNAVYVYLASAQPQNFYILNLCIGIEQFGYGFGFTAYMLFMITVAKGAHKTSHYAICTGFMALGMMIPGMFSGWLQEIIGYKHFFIWILIATIPGLILIKFIPLDPEFGKKQEQKD